MTPNKYQSYLLYYSDKYHRLVWNIEKIHKINWIREDKELPSLNSKTKYSIHYGFSSYIEENELSIHLLLNKSIHNDILIQAKPLPQFILIFKGINESEYIQKFLLELKENKIVTNIFPVDLSKFKYIKNLTEPKQC
jgi:hypothetical protein